MSNKLYLNHKRSTNYIIHYDYKELFSFNRFGRRIEIKAITVIKTQPIEKIKEAVSAGIGCNQKCQE